MLTGALVRALMIAMLVLTPSLVMLSAGSNSEYLIVVVAIIAASMTFIEYYGRSPSIVEFRFAPPYNRLKYIGLFTTLLLVSLICNDQFTLSGSGLNRAFVALGNLVDFPYSPVRLMVLMLPQDVDAATVNTMRAAAGVSYLTTIVMVAVFVIFVRILNWPKRSGAFNVWMNMPLFDPTGGGDVLQRLKRDSGLNIVLGVLLPFIIPAAVKAASDLVDPISMTDPHTMIWTVTAWAFLPASMLMRGIAMNKIAEMIEEKRRRAYAQAEAGALQRA